MLVITTITINPSRFSSSSSRQNNSTFSALSQIQHVFTYLSTEGLVLWMGSTLLGKRSVEVMSGPNSDLPLVNTKRMYALPSSLSLSPYPSLHQAESVQPRPAMKDLGPHGNQLHFTELLGNRCPFSGIRTQPGAALYPTSWENPRMKPT